jgi:hypothetical protein
MRLTVSVVSAIHLNSAHIVQQMDSTRLSPSSRSVCRDALKTPRGLAC